MTIAIDYDDTYTRDPDLWDDFITAAHNGGHLVICVTNRPWAPNTSKHERVPCVIKRDLKLDPIPVICAGDKFKVDAAREAGYSVHVWIDDTPGSIDDTPGSVSQTVQLP
jgi:hypothetical protein